MASEELKKRREESGQTLKEIAQALKLRSDYLRAIEEEEFEKLPVEVYARGYIRDYARFLKVDPDPILKAYMLKISPPPPTEKTPAAEKQAEKKSSTKYLLIIALILLIIAGYLFLSRTQETTIVKPAQPKQETQPLQQKEEKTDVPVIEEKIIPPVEPKPVIPKEYVLEISATETTWLLVTIDEAESKEMTLSNGDSVEFSAKKGFSVKIGNAGGVKLALNGNEIGVPGKSGQVITLNLPEGRPTEPEKPRATQP